MVLWPWIQEAGKLITAKEAERRVLVLENPGLRGRSRVTHSLYAGLQLILPGEVAPAHRHSQSALRFIVQGKGAYTAVDGERVTMSPGDFIITPSWTWHDHGNPSSEPMVWLDGLDIAIVELARRPVPRAARRRVADDHTHRRRVVRALRQHDAPGRLQAEVEDLAALLVPVRADARGAGRAREGRRSKPLLRPEVQDSPTPPPAAGRSRPSAASCSSCRRASAGSRHRSTDSTCYSVVEGKGRVKVAGETFAFNAKDHFVVPSWAPSELEADDETVLFSFSDRPVQEALDLFREQAS